MKKILSIFAISLITLNFVSCREDAMDLEAETAIPQARTTAAVNKAVVSGTVSDSTKANKESLREEGDPDKDPPRDRTRW